MHDIWLILYPVSDPGAAGGIDLDSELITELAIECPNLAGVKLTCVDKDECMLMLMLR